jgi:hypothetical protein
MEMLYNPFLTAQAAMQSDAPKNPKSFLKFLSGYPERRGIDTMTGSADSIKYRALPGFRLYGL